MSSEFDEFFSEYDGSIDAGGEEVARTAELRIKQYLGKDKMPSGCKYLALGTGAATAELLLARSLHIPDENITLVEKQPMPDILNRLKTKHPKINYQYGEGLYHFLENTTGQYDLVSAFLLEKLFDDSHRMARFITLLSQRVRPGAIISVLPYNKQDHVWRSNGFEPLLGAGSDVSTAFYTFKGIHR